jgi:glyoxylase-like metal-dependent hydrolase (beta-lactamase superfamily II)
MPKIIGIALFLCIGIGMTAQSQQDPPKMVMINDSVYMAPAAGNVYLITTPAGNVVIDTALHDQAAAARNLLLAELHGPVKYIILTHGHVDHIGGINLWKEPGTQIIAQRNYVEFVNYVTRLDGSLPRAMRRRSAVHPRQ